MITMTVIVKVRSEKRKEFLQVVRSLTDDGEQHEGLRKFKLNQENKNPTGFSLIYEWEAKEDLDRYLGTEEFRVLLGALKVLGEKSEIGLEDKKGGSTTKTLVAGGKNSIKKFERR
jgi:quinol monooxygenase YgiN